MDSTRLGALARSLVVEPGVAPAAVIAFAVKTITGWRIVAGASGIRSLSRPEPVTVRTVFDLASVTKPVTAAAAARLAERKALDLSTPLSHVLEEAHGTPSADCPLELIFCHRAGLEAHHELWQSVGRPFDRSAALARACSARRAECTGPPPAAGFAPVYSDLGYIIAGEALSRLTGLPLEAVIEREVSHPLGVSIRSARQWRHLEPKAFEGVAPTETVLSRGGEIVGEVHDDNAWALAGDATAGHAGLFATAEAVATFGAAVLDAVAGRSNWLGAALADWLVRPRPGGTLRAGFDGRAPSGSSAGGLFGSRAFGHLGFTGTSLWCEPDVDLAAVALTNRVCPSRDHVAIRQVRPKVHDELYRAAMQYRDEIAAGGPDPA
jgi:CubicO group peptidase (beta-lactamase class C family)